MTSRRYSRLDEIVHGFDQALHTVFGPTPVAGRANPAAAGADAANAPSVARGPRLDPIGDAELTDAERDLAARLMRVNHVGEVCAQALYQGQALTARDKTNREKLEQASDEENDHLAWTAQRVSELGGRLSLLNPLWYGGALAIGTAAGLAGDRWSLGFLAETERQVVAHLESHLGRLPEHDTKSRAIVTQMREDEGRHATVAIEAGGHELPEPVKSLMKAASRVMTRTAYWI